MHNDRGGGWKEIEKVYEMFCKRIFGIPSTAARAVCVRKLGGKNRREKLWRELLNILKDCGKWMRQVF
jgi:hypothetical protein